MAVAMLDPSRRLLCHGPPDHDGGHWRQDSTLARGVIPSLVGGEERGREGWDGIGWDGMKGMEDKEWKNALAKRSSVFLFVDKESSKMQTGLGWID